MTAEYVVLPPRLGTSRVDLPELRWLLSNAARYLTDTWVEPTTFGGSDEQAVRGSAMAAYALAVALRADGLEPAAGVDADLAEAKAVRLVTGLANAHVTAGSGGPSWGRAWQSPLHASWVGITSWLLWGVLPADVRERVAVLLADEADRLTAMTEGSGWYYRNDAGQVIFLGDTKAEEDSWNAQGLATACVMMPRHPRVGVWRTRLWKLCAASFSHPADTTSVTVVSGKAIRDWIAGSNIESNGAVVNHGKIAPDYMTTISQLMFIGQILALTGLPIPTVATWNVDRVYGAFSGAKFATPGYAAPGGTIYVPGSPGAIYYPQGADWGNRIHQFMLVDACMSTMDLDRYGARPAGYWFDQHLTACSAMQQRSSTGQFYVDPAEDSYPAREQLAAVSFAQAWLSYVLRAHDRYRFSESVNALTW